MNYKIGERDVCLECKSCKKNGIFNDWFCFSEAFNHWFGKSTIIGKKEMIFVSYNKVERRMIKFGTYLCRRCKLLTVAKNQ